MNTLEDRLRAALGAQAETFAASDDAWQRIGARTRPGIRRRSVRHWTRRAQFLWPAAAAVAVVAVVLGATALAHGFAGTPASSSASSPAAHRAGTVPVRSTGPAGQLLATDPAISAIIHLAVTRDVTTWAWIGSPSPLYWFPYISTGPQFCHWTTASNGGGSGDCWPLPSLSAARPAVVIANNDTVGIGHPVISGVAGQDVASVTAVFPDGQRFPGVIGTGRGFPVKAWSVTCPTVRGIKLIFTGAAGQILATLGTGAPVGPIVLDLPQPAHGGVTIFRYPADGRGVPGGTVTAYLVGGHVAFFAPQSFGGIFSPAAIAGPPPIAGVVQPFGYVRVKKEQLVLARAFGYADADVATVTIPLPDGGRVTTATIAAGWPDADVRLWQISLSATAWKAGTPTMVVIAYNAAGQVVGHERLGQPQI